MEKIAEKVKRMMRAAGFDCCVSGSNLSGSCYVKCSHDNYDTIEIRISDHELPLTYANNHTANYEIADNSNYANAFLHEWWKVPQMIFDSLGISYPATLKSLITKESTRKARWEKMCNEMKAEKEAKLINEKSKALSFYTQNKDKIDSLLAKIDSCTGKLRKRARAKYQEFVPAELRAGIKALRDDK